MKTFSLGLLALATALAISPVALAQTYNFSYTSGGYSGSGWLVAGGGFSGGLNVASGDLVFNGEDFSLLANSTPGQAIYSPSGAFIIDNLLFPSAGASGGLLDNYGLLFVDAAQGVELNIWGNGIVNGYSLYKWVRGNYVIEDSGTFNITTPEYSDLSMLLLSALTLVGGFIFKTRHPGISLAF